MIVAETLINPKKRLMYAISAIRGIGLSRARLICERLDLDCMLFFSDLTSDKVRALSDIITSEYGDVVGSNLRRYEQQKIQAIMSLGSYRGLRHRKGLPVRGQRTHSNAKTRRKLSGKR